MPNDERLHRIGVLLGTEFALYEHDLMVDSDNEEARKMIVQISEVYRNFSVGDLPGFRDDFERGYKLGRRDVEMELESSFSNSSDQSPVAGLD